MLQQYADYNVWANKTISGYILNAESLIDKPVVSSFTSIRKTLYHIWDAQAIWLLRLNDKSISGWPSKDFKGDIKEACDSLEENSKLIAEYVRQTPSAKEITYKTLDGNSYSSKVEEIIMHVVNHGTYHRGQLITLLRQVGFTEVGSTDFIRYCRLSNS